MAAKLSGSAREMLEQAGCTDVADDYFVLPGTDIMVLLSQVALADLNRQADIRAHNRRKQAEMNSPRYTPKLLPDL